MSHASAPTNAKPGGSAPRPNPWSRSAARKPSPTPASANAAAAASWIGPTADLPPASKPYWSKATANRSNSSSTTNPSANNLAPPPGPPAPKENPPSRTRHPQSHRQQRRQRSRHRRTTHRRKSHPHQKLTIDQPKLSPCRTTSLSSAAGTGGRPRHSQPQCPGKNHLQNRRPRHHYRRGQRRSRQPRKLPRHRPLHLPRQMRGDHQSDRSQRKDHRQWQCGWNGNRKCVGGDCCFRKIDFLQVSHIRSKQKSPINSSERIMTRVKQESPRSPKVFDQVLPFEGIF